MIKFGYFVMENLNESAKKNRAPFKMALQDNLLRFEKNASARTSLFFYVESESAIKYGSPKVTSPNSQRVGFGSCLVSINTYVGEFRL